MGSDLSIVVQTCVPSPTAIQQQQQAVYGHTGPPLSYVELRIIEAKTSMQFVANHRSSGSSVKGHSDGNEIHLLEPRCSLNIMTGAGGRSPSVTSRGRAYGHLRTALSSDAVGGRVGVAVDESVGLGRLIPQFGGRFTQTASLVLSSLVAATQDTGDETESAIPINFYVLDLRACALADEAAVWITMDVLNRVKRVFRYQAGVTQEGRRSKRQHATLADALADHNRNILVKLPVITKDSHADAFCASLQYLLFSDNEIGIGGIVLILGHLQSTSATIGCKKMRRGAAPPAAAGHARLLLPFLALVDFRRNDFTVADSDQFLRAYQITSGAMTVYASPYPRDPATRQPLASRREPPLTTLGAAVGGLPPVAPLSREDIDSETIDAGSDRTSVEFRREHSTGFPVPAVTAAPPQHDHADSSQSPPDSILMVSGDDMLDGRTTLGAARQRRYGHSSQSEGAESATSIDSHLEERPRSSSDGADLYGASYQYNEEEPAGRRLRGDRLEDGHRDEDPLHADARCTEDEAWLQQQRERRFQASQRDLQDRLEEKEQRASLLPEDSETGHPAPTPRHNSYSQPRWQHEQSHSVTLSPLSAPWRSPSPLTAAETYVELPDQLSPEQSFSHHTSSPCEPPTARTISSESHLEVTYTSDVSFGDSSPREGGVGGPHYREGDAISPWVCHVKGGSPDDHSLLDRSDRDEEREGCSHERGEHTSEKDRAAERPYTPSTQSTGDTASRRWPEPMYEVELNGVQPTPTQPQMVDCNSNEMGSPEKSATPWQAMSPSTDSYGEVSALSLSPVVNQLRGHPPAPSQRTVTSRRSFDSPVGTNSSRMRQAASQRQRELQREVDVAAASPPSERRPHRPAVGLPRSRVTRRSDKAAAAREDDTPSPVPATSPQQQPATRALVAATALRTATGAPLAASYGGFRVPPLSPELHTHRPSASVRAG